MSKQSRQRSVSPRAAPPSAQNLVPEGVEKNALKVALEPPGFSAVWRRIQDFAGCGAATYLWPRWLVLRAVGIVFLFVFAGIIADAQAFVGPHGLAPLEEFFAQLRTLAPGPVHAFIEAPSFFWISSGAGMVSLLAWSGFLAALALVLNRWPRVALAGCWSIFLSFAATWRVFSPAQLDNLMLEVALLCIPFAPAGWKPGLGATCPPRPVVVFMLRWLLFRVMFESGIVKLVAGDPHWRNFTAMDVMYETSPFPTFLAYWDHQLPHAYHLFEIALTFVAELVTPLAAVFGGRRGRWFALAVWTVFQAGIQLTSNFGWLNTASIGLGLLLLDDQMVAAAIARMKSFLPRAVGGPPNAPACTPAAGGWRNRALGIALWIHFACALFFFTKACGLPASAVPAALAWPLRIVSEFRSVNEYSLYATIDPVRYQVEFEGSNDGGQTWRHYRYRFLPQTESEMAPFFAPRFARFEATLQISAAGGRKSSLMPAVAAHLLARNPEVMRLFRADPFPDRPPTIVRMRSYRYELTGREEHRRSGHYWRKELVGDYLPAIYRAAGGEFAEASLAAGDEALQKEDYAGAFAYYEAQYKVGNLAAGFRLADLTARGIGVRANPEKAFALLTELSHRGEPAAEHYLGTCYEHGIGVALDYSHAAHHYRAAAERGYLPALYSLGALYARDQINPRDDVTGLSLLLRAIARARGDDPASQAVREDQAGNVARLERRMTPEAIVRARQQAATAR